MSAPQFPPAVLAALGRPSCTVAFAMPSKWTFSIPPIEDFVDRHTAGCACIVDPFAGISTVAHFRNDLAHGGVDAEEYVRDLMSRGVRADCVIFDPPYSPRQISECYKSIGRKATREDTQNARLYKRVRDALAEILVPGGMALSFGWQSGGFGRDWHTVDLLLVQHGGAHNDTICVAQRKESARDAAMHAADSEALDEARRASPFRFTAKPRSEPML